MSHATEAKDRMWQKIGDTERKQQVCRRVRGIELTGNIEQCINVLN